jgi:hypothetical protein
MDLLECVAHQHGIIRVVFDEENRTHGAHSNATRKGYDGLSNRPCA